MNLLVTGASGFVGRGLIPWLTAAGHGGWATGRTPPDSLPAGWQGAPREEFLSGSRSGSGIEAVVHLEVRQHVPKPTAADLESFEQVNVGGTQDWLDWATRQGVRRFVCVSSIKAVAPASSPRLEEAPLETAANYGGSKARAEERVRRWAAADPRRTASILRPAPVYGPGNEANLAAFVRQIRAGRPCLVGRGATCKSVVSRTNLAAAIGFALGLTGSGCETFNVSDRETYSLNDLATLIAKLAAAPPPRRVPAWLACCVAPLGDLFCTLSGRDFPLTSSRLRAIEEVSIFPCDKLVAAGYVHPCSTQDALHEMLQWMKSADDASAT